MGRGKRNPEHEFKPQVRRIVASRVAWHCSYPGCNAHTIGPGLRADEFTLNGQAAHIHAASENGPRYRSDLTQAEISSIHNAIWMCCTHASLIDKPTQVDSFTAETLKKWKNDSEVIAGQRLQLPGQFPDIPLAPILVMFGLNVVASGHWYKVQGNHWTFEIANYVYGNDEKIRDWCSHFAQVSGNEQFVVVETQGDGRMVLEPPIWKSSDGKTLIEVAIGKPSPRREVTGLKDLSHKKFLKPIEGIEVAIEHIERILGMPIGSWKINKELGSQWKKFYDLYQATPELLERLLRLDFARLINIPQNVGNTKVIQTALAAIDPPIPVMNYVERIDQIRILDSKLTNGSLSVEIKLVWYEGEEYIGIWSIPLPETSVSPPLPKLPEAKR